MAVDDARLLLDHILQHQLLYTLIRLVSVQLPALVDRVLLQQLCLRPGRLYVLHASVVLRIAKGTGNFRRHHAESDAGSAEPDACLEIATASEERKGTEKS